MIGFWLGVIAVCCVIFAALLLWLAVIGARTVLDWWGRCWRDARAVIEQTKAEFSDEPVPHRPAGELDEKTVSRIGSLLFCPVCHPGGHGRCTCVAYCGDRQCTYGYTTQLSAEEAAWLRGLGIKEGTEQ